MTKDILPTTAVPFNSIYVVDITPELAKDWLKSCKTCRSVSENHVQRLAEQMSAGLWHRNHDGLAFAEDGTIIDGLHRLHAVAQSGKTITMLVVLNEPAENVAVVDNRNIT